MVIFVCFPHTKTAKLRIIFIRMVIALADLASHYIHGAFKSLDTSVSVATSSISFSNLYHPTITYSVLTVLLAPGHKIIRNAIQTNAPFSVKLHYFPTPSDFITKKPSQPGL